MLIWSSCMTAREYFLIHHHHNSGISGFIWQIVPSACHTQMVASKIDLLERITVCQLVSQERSKLEPSFKYISQPTNQACLSFLFCDVRGIAPLCLLIVEKENVVLYSLHHIQIGILSFPCFSLNYLFFGLCMNLVLSQSRNLGLGSEYMLSSVSHTHISSWQSSWILCQHLNVEIRSRKIFRSYHGCQNPILIA